MAIQLNATRTQGKFILSNDTIVCLVGAMGEGKSYAAVMALLGHAERCRPYFKKNEKLQCAIIRDTHENMKHSVVKTFQEFFDSHPEIKYNWKSDYKSLDIGTEPGIHCDLFGIDDVAALTKLQGSTYGCIWLEELAPYTDSARSNAGISEDVFNAAIVRCARQTNAPPRLQCTSNPCDEDHWMYRRLIEPEDGPVHEDTPEITKKVFQIPYGENVFLREVSRQATKAAFANDEAAYARFVRGEFATKYPGQAVATHFNKNWHVSEDELFPISGYDGFISFDSWGSPAAVIGTQGPDGRVYILECLTGASDVRGLIRDYIKPCIHTPKWEGKITNWRVMGDATMNQPDQSNMAMSAAIVVEEAFLDEAGRPLHFEPGPSTWFHVKSGMLHALRWTVKGKPAVLIDPKCKGLIASLSGRWHYSKNKGGVVNYSKPVKNDASHLADAFSNAMCVLAAWDPPKRRQDNQRVNFQMRRRAESYATQEVGVG